MINRAKQNKINTWKRFFEKSTYFIAINFWYEWIWSDITVLRTVFHFVWDWIGIKIVLKLNKKVYPYLRRR